VDEPTDVMSLDELMDLAATRGNSAVREAPTMPIRRSLPTTTAAPAPMNPAARPVARQAYDAGLARSRVWLETGDNRLIAATVAVTLLLLLVVTAL
jgi:hypothetical protein